MVFDTVIIGASAAGISSAIYLLRRGITPLILGYDLGGEMALSGEVGNYPGLGMTDGYALTKKFLAHLKQYGAEPVLSVRVTGLEKSGNNFLIKGWQGTQDNLVSYHAKSVIIASGSHPRELGVPGEKELRGKGVSYCTVCDGPLFKDKNTVTIGGGDSASESGIMLNEIAAHHYVLTKNSEMKGDTSLINKLRSLPKVSSITNALTIRILGNEFVTGLEYQDAATKELKQIEVQGVFIHIGMIANADFVMPELEKNRAGEIVVDKYCKTNLPGIFAAGDVTDVQYKQIGVAVGQGICAALSCVDYLNKS